MKYHFLNLLVKWAALTLHISKAPGSNLDPEIGYRDWDDRDFVHYRLVQFRGSTFN